MPRPSCSSAFRDRQWERFVALSALCDRFAQATFVEPMEGYIRRMLWAAAAEGAIPREACDDPWGPALPELGEGVVDQVGARMRAQLARDFERFGRRAPARFRRPRARGAIASTSPPATSASPLPHPIGKGSGQLSLNQEQLETDRAAGLAFVVLKTVIAEDAAGVRAMDAWAIHETRMKVETVRSASGLGRVDGDVEGQRLGSLVRRLPGAGAGRGGHDPLGRDGGGALGEVSSPASGRELP